MSIFGGIFKVWFGGKAKARRNTIIKLQAQAEADRLLDDNTPGIDTGGDGGDTGGTGSDNQIAGKLAVDRNGSGTIDPVADTSFKNDKPGAVSDFEGLQSYDSNNDDVLDTTDPQFQKLGVWNDSNEDGQFQAGEFQTLSQLGVDYVDLAPGLSSGLLTVYKTDGSEAKIALSQTVTFP